MNKANLSFKELIHKINLKNIKKDNLIILFLIGVLLLIIVIPTPAKGVKNKDTSAKTSESVSQSENVSTTEDAYEKQLEQRLEDVLKEVENVGNVKVMITLKSSEERIVEKDIPTSRSSIVETDSDGGSRATTETSNTEETIYETGENGETTPYVVKEMEPEIEGVLVIASGGDNPVVVQNISDAVQALFPVEAHKIKIMKMNR